MAQRIVMLGPPGAGKGTQAERLAQALDVPLVITGDLLRSAVREGTELGRQAQAYLDRGELVPNELVVAMIQSQLEQVDGEGGFVLDGFPRNRAQAEALDEITEIDRAVLLEIPREVVIERLSARRVCPECGQVYNLVSEPPHQEGQCDDCGASLEQRSDDAPEVVARRYDVQYRDNVQPLIELYRERGVLVTVDGQGEIDEVTERLLEAVRTSEAEAEAP